MRRLFGALALLLPLLMVGAAPSAHAGGKLVVAKGDGPVVGSGSRIRYRVAFEAGISMDRQFFVDMVQGTLGDRRGWGHANSFRRVQSAPYRFTVVLASRATTDQLCYPFQTNGLYSCYNNGRAVINLYRWRHGAASYAGHLRSYRHYVISHEIGHALGHQHQYSCLASGLAPVMMQQTKSLYGCQRNPWPFPWVSH